ncbi:TPA: hypothetical protein JL724_001154 [Legionella pneumophila]|nr:hypothetical protein [Legionella pneumophila]HAU1138398.1 hypothetical protein [Legionella pneumophila]HAW6245163.1 hypothetical protein [Legionella pneumophila]
MASPTEEYKFTVLYHGKRYAVMGHSIEKDESIYVRSRKKINKTKLVKSGKLINSSDNLLKMDAHSIATSVGNQLHYHPSGAVRRKEDRVLIRNDQFYPLINLPEPIALIKLSPPEIEWFDEVSVSSKEVIFDLGQIQAPFKRLDFQIWIGPKNCFKNGFRPNNTYASIIFENEVFYDVAYFIREMDLLEDRLKETAITAFPETNIPHDKIKSVVPELWVGCLAIGRQVRTFMDEWMNINKSEPDRTYPKLFNNGYHTRMSICSNGIIGAVGSRLDTNSDLASMEWCQFNLPVESVLNMLINRSGFSDFIDINKYDKKIPANTIFFRTEVPEKDKMKHELVVVGVESNNGYYQLPDSFTSRVVNVRKIWMNYMEKNTLVV